MRTRASVRVHARTRKVYDTHTHTRMHACRYAMLVTPINYMLCSVNVALFGSSAWHLGRKVTELCERARALSLSLSVNLSLLLPRSLAPSLVVSGAFSSQGSKRALNDSCCGQVNADYINPKK